MSNICIHDNVKETCDRCRLSHQCWQLFHDSDGKCYLQEFYSGKTAVVSKKYHIQIMKLEKSKRVYDSKASICEMKLTKIVGKILKGKNK